ncbi:MAG: lactate racemase domain-containing protein [Acidobacteria bacterium]|nr:lactate racemase domain-containing protein [Acidobacteriota bacterium]
MTQNDSMPLGALHRLRRTGPSQPALRNLPQALTESLDGIHLDPSSLHGKRIAVTVGSRGIAHLALQVRTLGEWLKAKGAQPFIVPSMGSHGGATGEGQRRVLEDYGITEPQVGMPVLSQMEAVELGRTPEGFRVYMDRLAFESDGVVIFNRIKTHTDFSGRIESGWLKMTAIGLGKVQGARACHLYCRQYGYEKSIRSVGGMSLASGKILCAVGVIENEEHEICAVRAARPERMPEVEEQALVEARRMLPRLPFPKIDLLVVDQLGKNISGTGFDTKVIGRGVPLQAGEAPQIQLIYVRDITKESEGNAIGIGMADLMHERIRKKIDIDKTYINTQAALNPPMGFLPMHSPSDGEALRFLMGVLGDPAPPEAKVVWIKNTLLLAEILASEAALNQPQTSGAYETESAASASTPTLDSEGNLNGMWETVHAALTA